MSYYESPTYEVMKNYREFEANQEQFSFEERIQLIKQFQKDLAQIDTTVSFPVPQ